MIELPETYKENMQKLLKEEYPAYLDSFHSDRVYGLRVNTNKISIEEFLKIAPFHLTKIPFISNGFYYQEQDRPAKHPFYYAGLYYLQEPSAMLPAEILPVKLNDRVLDGCAAPGGKTTQLACKMADTGLLLSNDISASRAQGLLKNVELAGLGNCVVASEDLNKLADYFPEYFDAMLIDAPCSGEGMFRKDPSLIKSWVKKGNDYYSEIQKGIIDSAITMLKPGGKMVYSTCTFSPKEDEEVVQYLLDKHPECFLIDIEKQEGFASGVNGLTQCVRIYPHKIQGEGHFVALIQKGCENTNQTKITKASNSFVSDEFFDLLNKKYETSGIKQIGDKLLYESEEMLQLPGIRMLRTGLLIGRYKKDGQFEPSTSFALTLRKNDFKQVIDFDIEDIRVLKYLKCETIDVSEYSYNGWVLICTQGYPLGFGKISNGVFKNKYDKNWRYI